MLEAKTDLQDQKEVSRPHRRNLVFIIGALSAFGPFSIDMYLPGLPSLTRDLNGETWQVQLTLTACLLGLAFGQVVVGPLSDSLGRKRPLLAGLFLYAAASLLCAMAPSVPVLIGLRLLQGVAGAAGIVIARAIVRDLFSGKEVARFFSMTMAVSGIAPIIAPVVGGQLLNFTSWRGVFLVLTGFGIALMLAAGLGLEETLPPSRRRASGLSSTLAGFRELLADRNFVGYALAAGLAFTAMFSYISGSPFVLEDIYHVSPQVFSMVFATNALGIVIVNQINGRLVKKVDPRTLMSIGLSTTLLGALVLLIVVIANVGLVGILPAFFMVVASVGFIAPNATALALSNHPRVAGSASGLLGVIQFVIGAVVSPLVNVGGNGTALPLAIIMTLASAGALTAFSVLTRANPES